MFKSIIFPKIKRDDKYPNIKLNKIVVISIRKNFDINATINDFYEKRKPNSPYNNEKEYLLEICDKV